jgi:hypothetical protein
MQGCGGLSFQLSLRGAVNVIFQRRASNPYIFYCRALREQEGYLQKHSSNLIRQLRKRCTEDSLDMVFWFSLVTFDIMSGESAIQETSTRSRRLTGFVADLAFGEPAGCLDNADQPWLEVIGARAKSIVYYQFTIYYNIRWLTDYIAPKAMIEARRKHLANAMAKVKKRTQVQESANKDFMSYILGNKTEKLSNFELSIMASAFVVAGSGTSYVQLVPVDCNPELTHSLSGQVLCAGRCTSCAFIRIRCKRRLTKCETRSQKKRRSTWSPRVR